jgi:hypothetical protein
MNPALRLVPRAGQDVPPEHEVLEIIQEALESNRWNQWHDDVLSVRTETTEIQDEVPPADPIDITVVTVVLSQQHVTERYPGPFEIVLNILKSEFDQEVWIDAAST